MAIYPGQNGVSDLQVDFFSSTHSYGGRDSSRGVRGYVSDSGWTSADIIRLMKLEY